MNRRAASEPDPDMEGLPSCFDQMDVAESGLDWGDISQIRDKLALSPTERLRSAQEFMNSVIRIRNQNGDRA